MRAGIIVKVTRADRHRLEAIVSDRSAPQKHVWRANIILATADGCGTTEIMRRSGKSKPVVWRWQQRFCREGVDGLLRDKTRKPGKKPLAAATVAKSWRCRAAAAPRSHPLDRPHGRRGGRRQPARGAAHLGGEPSSAASGPHLQAVERPEFRRKRSRMSSASTSTRRTMPWCSRSMRRSQIQALDRTQPGLPMKPGRCGTMTHDYKRNGTTTLFAALNVLDGTVIGRCMPRHRHQEFIRFLNTIERRSRPARVIHAIVDNYATHKHPKVRHGSPGIRAGHSTSPRPRPPGSTPSKASSPSSPAGGSSAASSNPSSTSRPPSTASSPRPTMIPNPSSGPPTPTESSPLSREGSKR